MPTQATIEIEKTELSEKDVERISERAPGDVDIGPPPEQVLATPEPSDRVQITSTPDTEGDEPKGDGGGPDMPGDLGA